MLHSHFELIRARLDVKTLSEYYTTSRSYSQLCVQPSFGQLAENPGRNTMKDERVFTDLNPIVAKRTPDRSNQTFKIDYVRP